MLPPSTRFRPRVEPLEGRDVPTATLLPNGPCSSRAATTRIVPITSRSPATVTTSRGGAANTLTGGDGLDWFWCDVGQFGVIAPDFLTDRDPLEFLH